MDKKIGKFTSAKAVNQSKSQDVKTNAHTNRGGVEKKAESTKLGSTLSDRFGGDVFQISTASPGALTGPNGQVGWPPDGWGTFLSWALDSASMLPPPFGTAADLACVIRDAVKGDKLGTVLSAIGLIPAVGDALKLAGMAIKAGTASVDAVESLYKMLSDPQTLEAMKGIATKLDATTPGLGKILLDGFDELDDLVQTAKKTLKTNVGSTGEMVSSQAHRKLLQQVEEVARKYRIPQARRQDFHEWIENEASQKGGTLTYQELDELAQVYTGD